MEEVGQVVETRNGAALVRVQRHSACDKCHKKCGLAGSHGAKELVLEAKTELPVTRGQMVRIEMGEEEVLRSAVIVYILPIFNMILGYSAALWLADKLGYDAGEGTGIIGALLSLAISFLIIRRTNRRLESDPTLQPRITAAAEKMEQSQQHGCH